MTSTCPAAWRWPSHLHAMLCLIGRAHPEALRPEGSCLAVECFTDMTVFFGDQLRDGQGLAVVEGQQSLWQRQSWPTQQKLSMSQHF